MTQTTVYGAHRNKNSDFVSESVSGSGRGQERKPLDRSNFQSMCVCVFIKQYTSQVCPLCILLYKWHFSKTPVVLFSRQDHKNICDYLDQRHGSRF